MSGTSEITSNVVLGEDTGTEEGILEEFAVDFFGIVHRISGGVVSGLNSEASGIIVSQGGEI